MEAHLLALQQPPLVALTETFLDDSVPVACLSGYQLISRRDRRDRFGGGIALFALDAIAASVVHLDDSPTHERAWYILHTDIGAVALAVWYRPPSYSEHESITSLRSETERYSVNCIGVLIVGDVNVHNSAWLVYSNGISRAGRCCFQTCSELGLQECTAAPTRGPYLLDLTLCTFPECVSTDVLPGVSDHNMVLCKCAFPMSFEVPTERFFFQFQHARWRALRAHLRQHPWLDKLATMQDPNVIAEFLTHTILEASKLFIPYGSASRTRTVHPWINETCLKAVRDKHASRGTHDYPALQERCSAILQAAYHAHVVRVKRRLVAHAGNQKKWWKLSLARTLRKASSSSIPALRKSRSDDWVTDSFSKAEL